MTHNECVGPNKCKVLLRIRKGLEANDLKILKRWVPVLIEHHLKTHWLYDYDVSSLKKLLKYRTKGK